MSQIQTKFIANAAVTPAKLGTVTDGSTLDQSGAGSTLEIKAGGVTNTQVSATAAIAYSKLASLGGSTNAVLSQNSSGFVQATGILSGNLFLADGTVNATGAFNMNSHQINNVTNPSSAQDAATKSYVDSAINGLFWQPPVQAIATSNVPLTGSVPLTIDGYTVANGDRLILKGQSTASQNNVYTAAVAGTYTLTVASVPASVGDAYLVLQGTTYAETGFVYSATNTFTQFASIASTYTAGNGLQLIGNAFSAKLADSSLSATGSGLSVVEDPAGAIITGGSGIKIQLEASNPSLQISSNALGLKIDPNAGLEKGSAGTGILLPTSSGLSTSSSGLMVALQASSALTLGTTGLAVNPDTVGIKINGSNQLTGQKGTTFAYTLTATDITNQYVDFTTGNGFLSGAQVASGTSASANSIELVAGGLVQRKGTDYTVSLTGGSGGSTRVTFAGDLATGGNIQLVAGDLVTFEYSYL